MSGKQLWRITLGIGIALAGSLAASAQQVYIPLVSKGFQHQFWQSVKAGAEQAGQDFDVKVTFEGPESKAMLDKQIDMLAAVLAKNPKAIVLAALDKKAVVPLLKKAQAAKVLVVPFDPTVNSHLPEI